MIIYRDRDTTDFYETVLFKWININPLKNFLYIKFYFEMLVDPHDGISSWHQNLMLSGTQNVQ